MCAAISVESPSGLYLETIYLYFRQMSKKLEFLVQALITFKFTIRSSSTSIRHTDSRESVSSLLTAEKSNSLGKARPRTQIASSNLAHIRKSIFIHLIS